MTKKRILLHTNPVHLKTGLAENARTLLKYLWKTGKYEIAHYCSQINVNEPQLKYTPWKSYGCLPVDPASVHQLNQDPGKLRNAVYGAWNIDAVMKDFKPDIYIGSDDAWGFPKGDYIDKPWWKKINSVLHITIDSLPVLEQALEQAHHTKYFFTWAKFASNEMKRLGPQFSHVSHIYGAMDTTKFAPISKQDRTNLRKRFGIAETTTIFLFVGRNQLRKQFIQCLEAFAHFKRENPQADAKLWFHTSYSEKHNGWDIPKMAGYYGVNMKDILATYVCKHCGEWFVAPYGGEDLDCPVCKTQKSLITATITNGVSEDQMKHVYGISDACVSAFSSGGLEYHNVQSLLCGKPLASTNYSAGVDFCEQPFVYTLGYTTYIEQHTNFIKATTNIQDIKKFFHKIWKTPPRELEEIGEKGRAWAVKTFSIESIGAQWEKVFDAMPVADWNQIDWKPVSKNAQFPFPVIDDADQFITTLYREVLKMEEPPNGEGRKHWHQKLKEGMKREDVYSYFLKVAADENVKNQAASQDLWSFIDKTTGRKRAIFVIKESLGDCLMCSQLFESFHIEYPNHDLYVATKPENFKMFEGNPYVFKLLPHADMMEQEMVMCGAAQKEADAYFHVFLMPAVGTQKWLKYLFSEPGAFKSHLSLT